MRIAIFGAGAVGVYLAAKLLAAGCDVWLAARGATLARARQAGMRLTGQSGALQVPPERIVDSAAAPAKSFDLVVIAVKRPANADIAPAMLAWLAGCGHVVSVQNGLDAAGAFRPHLGAGQSASAATLLSSLRRTGQAEVHQAGQAEAAICLDAAHFGESGPRAGFVSALKAAGLTVRLSHQIAAETWRKTIFISAYGGLCAVTGQNVAGLRRAPDLMATLAAAFAEGVDLAASALPAPPAEERARLQAWFDALPGANRPSILGDLDTGAKTELPFLLQALLDHAKRHDLPAPLLGFLAAGVSARQNAEFA